MHKCSMLGLYILSAISDCCFAIPYALLRGFRDVSQRVGSYGSYWAKLLFCRQSACSSNSDSSPWSYDIVYIAYCTCYYVIPSISQLCTFALIQFFWCLYRTCEWWSLWWLKYATLIRLLIDQYIAIFTQGHYCLPNFPLPVRWHFW